MMCLDDVTPILLCFDDRNDDVCENDDKNEM